MLTVGIDLDGAIEAVVEVNLDVRPAIPLVEADADKRDGKDGEARDAKARAHERRLSLQCLRLCLALERPPAASGAALALIQLISQSLLALADQAHGFLVAGVRRLESQSLL